MVVLSLDVWHTLIYLTPDEEDEYYRAQVRLGEEALETATVTDSARAERSPDLGRLFEDLLVSAATAAASGRTVTPRAQIVAAAARAGRTVDADEYLGRLDALVVRQPFRAAPGAVIALGELQRVGVRLGVVGNTVGETGRSLRRVLERLGLERGIESFVFSDEHPWSKPAPEPFGVLLRELRVGASEVIHIGDSWTDIVGAERAGLGGSIQYTGVARYGRQYRALNRVGEEPRAEATRVVDRWDEVPSIVREMGVPVFHR